MVRKGLQSSVSLLLVCALLLFGVNYVVRISDRDASHGIIENMVFDRSAWSTLLRLFRSEELKHWSDANELSSRVASRLSLYGSSLATDTDRHAERKQTARYARGAYEHALAVPTDYLPKYYTEYFIEGMRLCAEGLEMSDQIRLREGIRHYNLFLEWIQSQDRDSFNALR